MCAGAVWHTVPKSLPPPPPLSTLLWEQESKITRMIRKQLVRRSIDMIEELAGAEGGEDYRTFWEAFGRNLKVGVIEDEENRKKLAPLLRFFSSAAAEDGKLTSLDEYVLRMKEGQKQIFYMAADTLDVARSAPFVEKLLNRGFEVRTPMPRGGPSWSAVGRSSA